MRGYDAATVKQGFAAVVNISTAAILIGMIFGMMMKVGTSIAVIKNFAAGVANKIFTVVAYWKIRDVIFFFFSVMAQVFITITASVIQVCITGCSTSILE